MLISVFGFAQFPAPYCGPLTFTDNVEPITLVNFAGINNSTDATVGAVNPAHEDFTAIVGNVSAGSTYSITLKGNTDGASYTTKLRVFIDWNQNNDFTDAGESYDIGDITGSTGTDAIQLVGSIAVPVSALAGNTRMRVVKRYSTYATSCQTGFGYGQAEDYTLSVTIPACVPPSDLVSSNVTSASATILWTAPSVAPSEGYDYYYTTSSTAPISSTVPSGSVAAGITSVSLSSLTPASVYYIYVRAKCSTTSFSDWSSASLTTLCVAVTSFSENFDTTAVSAFPTCWGKVGTTGLSNLQTTNPNSSPNTLYIYSDSSTNQAVVKTVAVSNLGAGTHRLRFKMRGNFTAGDDLEIGYLTDPTDETTFIPLDTFTADSLTYSDYIFTPPAGSYSENLAFRHAGALGFSILIDDVVWEAIPSCLEPSAGLTTVTSSTTADLSWTSGGAANAEILIQQAGSGAPAIADNTGINVSGSTYSATSLSPQTAYEFYVRDECVIGTSFSTWSGPFSFNTTQLPGCATLTFPADGAIDVPVGDVTFTWDAPTTGDPAVSYDLYGSDTLPLTTADFVGNFTTTSALITLSGYSTTFYWTVVPVNVAGDADCLGSPFSFTTEDAPPPPANDDCLNAVSVTIDDTFCNGTNTNGTNLSATDSGVTAASCFNNGTNDVWFSFVVPSDVATVDVSTDFTGGTLVDTQIALYSGACNSLTEVDCDQDSGTTILSNNSSWNSLITNTPVIGGDTYYVRVSGYSSSTTQGTFCLKVSTNTLSNDSFDNTGFTSYPNPVKNLLNLTYSKNIEKVQVINLLGQEMIVKSMNETQGQVDMSQLSSGTYLVKVTSDNQVKTIKIVKE